MSLLHEFWKKRDFFSGVAKKEAVQKYLWKIKVNSIFFLFLQMLMNVKCIGWTKEGNSASMSVWTSLGHTTAPVLLVTSYFQMGGPVKVSDRVELRTKAHSRAFGCRTATVCMSIQPDICSFTRDVCLMPQFCFHTSPLKVMVLCSWKTWPHVFPAKTHSTETKIKIKKPKRPQNTNPTPVSTPWTRVSVLCHCCLSSRCGWVFKPEA